MNAQIARPAPSSTPAAQRARLALYTLEATIKHHRDCAACGRAGRYEAGAATRKAHLAALRRELATARAALPVAA